MPKGLQRDASDPHARRWWYALLVEVDGQVLWGIVGEKTHRVVADDCLLPAFVALADTDDPDAYHEFGQRWGPLWLCIHGLPSGHDWSFGLPDLSRPRDFLTQDMTDDSLIAMGCEARIPEDPPSDQHRLRETILEWRSLAIQAASILKVARNLASGKIGDEADWTAARWGQEGTNPLWRRRYRYAGPLFARHAGSDEERLFSVREEMRCVVANFADVCGIRPGLSGTFGVALDGGRGHALTSVIGAQLVQAVARIFEEA